MLAGVNSYTQARIAIRRSLFIYAHYLSPLAISGILNVLSMSPERGYIES